MKTVARDPLPGVKGIEVVPQTLLMKSMGDLLYYEGPLIVHCLNQKNEDYIMVWCGVDDLFNRWMLYKTTFPLLHRFFEGELTLRDLILDNPDGFVFLVDIDNNIDWKRAFKVELANLGPEYLPGQESGYTESGFEPYAAELKTYLHHHFTRQEKLYEIGEEATLLAMEPPADYLTKK